MRMPSVKTLQSIAGDRAGELRQLLTKQIKTRSYASVQALEKVCYHKPDYAYRLMTACNEIMGGYGVEAIYRHEGDSAPAYEYVNTGDTYALTLLRNCTTGSITVGSWGDIVERWG